MSHGGSAYPDRVLIAGAGPVGLLTALRLGQAGIKVDVIEKEEHLSERPRATGYYAAALLALKKARVLESVMDAGIPTYGLCWRKPLVDDGSSGKKMGDLIAKLTFPEVDDLGSGVIYPQSELGKLLFREAVATGFVTFHFGRGLCGIREEGDSVLATARTRDGKEEYFQGAFLVGADGGKSATRRLLGIPFKGYTWPERIVATDVLMENKDIDLRVHTSLIVDSINYGVVSPLEKPQAGKKTMYRCSVAVDPLDTRSDDELAAEASIMSLLEKMIPGPRPLDIEVKKVSPYKIHQLCASTFRRGRFVLTGDAAHLNNPIGAMGLCTGIIDADAVSDTLELIINDGKDLSLLDIYSNERRRVFQTFVDPVSAQNKLRCANDPETAAEDWFIRAAMHSSEAEMARLGSAFFDAWGTDMRTLVESS